MKEIFLMKLGEIVLKGANKRQFESRLRQNVRRRMRGYGNFDVNMSHLSAIAKVFEEKGKPYAYATMRYLELEEAMDFLNY